MQWQSLRQPCTREIGRQRSHDTPYGMSSPGLAEGFGWRAFSAWDRKWHLHYLQSLMLNTEAVVQLISCMFQKCIISVTVRHHKMGRHGDFRGPHGPDVQIVHARYPGAARNAWTASGSTLSGTPSNSR